jgi:hypothetical protein
MEVSGLVTYRLAKSRTWLRGTLQGNQTVSGCSRARPAGDLFLIQMNVMDLQNNLTAARICQDWTFNCLYSAHRLGFIQKIAAHI